MEALEPAAANWAIDYRPLNHTFNPKALQLLNTPASSRTGRKLRLVFPEDPKQAEGPSRSLEPIRLYRRCHLGDAPLPGLRHPVDASRAW